MLWQEISLLEIPLAAVTEPTNPSSLALAVVGIGTFLCYQFLARPGHEHRRPIAMAKPQAALSAVEVAPEERRVA
jgi:hypothetical protein